MELYEGCNGTIFTMCRLNRHDDIAVTVLANILIITFLYKAVKTLHEKCNTWDKKTTITIVNYVG